MVCCCKCFYCHSKCLYFIVRGVWHLWQVVTIVYCVSGCMCVHIRYFFALPQYTQCPLYVNFYGVLCTMWYFYDLNFVISHRSLKFPLFSSKLKIKIKGPPTNNNNFNLKANTFYHHVLITFTAELVLLPRKRCQNFTTFNNANML